MAYKHHFLAQIPIWSSSHLNTVAVEENIEMLEVSRVRAVLLVGALCSSYFSLALLTGVTPPFYPIEARKKGATPSQVRLNSAATWYSLTLAFGTI